MNWDKLIERVNQFYLDEDEGIKIPFSNDAFDRPVEPPHLMYTEIDTDNFGADNIVYFEKMNSRLELTTNIKDKDLEKRIENEILFDTFWNKTITYIPSEKVWNVSYFFEMI